MTNPILATSPLLNKPPARGSVSWSFIMGELAGAYIQERITDAEYVEAATAMGLSRDQATERCMALDAGSALGKYRRARRTALRFCRSSRFKKQNENSAIYGQSLGWWQMELVRLRRAYHRADQMKGDGA